MYGVTWTYTNTFSVRDGEQFDEAMQSYRVEAQGYGPEFELYGLDGNDNPGLWPDNDSGDENWFYKVVAAHLNPESVAIFYTFDVDNETQTYDAFAVAINSSGKLAKVDVHDIATIAATLHAVD